MDSNRKTPQDEHGREVIVISRRSFFGALLSVGTVGMGAMLAAPVLRFVLYPLYTKQRGSKWSKVGLVDHLPPIGSPPVRKDVTFRQLDGWREVVTTESVYVQRLPNGKCLVLSSICPHLGCNVSWQASSDRFFCPCHGSVFNSQGKHISGPAPRGMDPLPNEAESGELLVHFEYFRANVPNREELS